MSLNADPGCSRAMDSHVALSCSSGLDIIMTLGAAAKGIQITMSLVVEWPSDIGMVSGS